MVYLGPTGDYSSFTYVYEYIFKELGVTFPLTPFECGMLTVMNIAPGQLHPNNWAFFEAIPATL